MKLRFHPSKYFYIFWFFVVFFVIFFIKLKLILSFELKIILVFFGLVFVIIKKLRFLNIFICALLIVNFTTSNYVNQLNIYQKINQRQVQVCGRLINNSTYKNGSTIYRLNNLSFVGHKTLGKILVKTRQKQQLKRSNYVCGQGKMEVAEGGYNGLINDFRITKINKKTDNFTKIRSFLSKRLANLSPQSQDFANIILLGDKSFLSQKSQQKIRTVGLSHIVVVSGLHLMILVNFIRKTKIINSRKIEFWAIIILGLFFAAITGFSASMVRAYSMLIFSMVAWHYGRKNKPINLFVLIMGIGLLINPFYALFDTSWLLSYVAFWSVLVVAPAIKEYFGLTEINPLFDLVLTVLIIQIFLAPLLIYLFGSISIVSIFANLLIVPIITFLMISLIILLIISGTFLSKIVIFVVELITKYIFFVINFCLNLPIVKKDLTIGLNQILIIYFIFMLILSYLIYDNKVTKRQLLDIIEPNE